MKTPRPQYVERVIEAAADLFVRYGFARTTMGEIARAACISRPTLYQHFPSKEAAFEAAVLHLNQLRMAEIRAALAGVDAVDEQLFIACDLWLMKVFELQQTIPDARDMDDLAFPVVRTVYGELEAQIAEIIAAADHGKIDTDPAELASVLVFSIRGLGARARDCEHLRQLARVVIGLLAKALA